MTYAFDPELAPVVADLALGDFSDVAAARAAIDTMLADLNARVDTTGLTIEDRTLTGVDGNALPIRVYRPNPAPTTALPGILHIHGGGFAVGSIQTELGGAVQLASKVPAVVVSVDYRLAPEHPFPAPMEDCYTALTWLHAEAATLGVDTGRLALFGGSAGGGLAAGLALLARDRGGPALCFQFLGIPELDDRLETPSMRQFVDTPMWNRPSAVLSWRYYLGDAPGEVSPYAAPARAEDLSGLPPAFVSTMEFDPLRDEGITYALRLLQAGVSVELHQYPGTFHGSAMVTTAAVSQRQSAETIEVMRRALRA